MYGLVKDTAVAAGPILEMVSSYKAEQLEYETTEFVGAGMYTGIFGAGMQPVRFECVGTSRRLDIQHVPATVANDDSFEAWLRTTLGVAEKDVRWRAVRKRDDGSTTGHIVFTSDKAKAEAEKMLQAWAATDEAGTGKPMIKHSEREKFCRSFVLTAPGGVTEQAVRHCFGPDRLSKVKNFRAAEASYQLVIQDTTRDPSFFVNALPSGGRPMRVNTAPAKQVSVGGSMLTIGSPIIFFTFGSSQARDTAIFTLQRHPCMQNECCPITFFNKQKQSVYTKSVFPRFQPGKTDSEGGALFNLVAKDRAAADQISSASLSPGWSLKAQASVTVMYPEVHPELEEVAKCTAAKFSVRAVVGKPRDSHGGGKRVVVTLEGQVVADVGAAAAMLWSIVAPVRLSGSNDKQRAMQAEVRAEGLLARWARELGFAFEEDKYGGLQIYGPRQVHGQLLTKLMDYEVGFRKRYTLLSIDDQTNNLFRKGRAGESGLMALKQLFAGKCNVEHRNNLSAIHLLAAPKAPAGVLAEATTYVLQLLEEIGGRTLAEADCVFCTNGRRATHTLSLCGHRHCGCLSQISAGTLVSLPICCPRCATPVTSRDMQSIMEGGFQKLCESVTSAALAADRHTHKWPIVHCPSKSCTGLLDRGKGYRPCHACTKKVCGDCGMVEKDDFHQGRSCSQAAAAKAQFDKEKRELKRRFKRIATQLRGVVEQAEAFVKDSWPTDMPSTSRTDINPGLMVNSPSCQRFLKALKHLGLTGTEDLCVRGFFTWHGTPQMALPLICHNGFDPTKRSGQACGPGEVS